MAEMLNVKVIGTDEYLTIADAVPVESAKLFWDLSDSIWAHKPSATELTAHSVASALPPLEARDTLNRALGSISERLVVSGLGKSVKLHSDWPRRTITLGPNILDSPQTVSIGTFNWDERMTTRQVTVNGETKGAVFTDGHKDRYRELFASFSYTDDLGYPAHLTYAMQRAQSWQDSSTELTANMWHSSLGDTGHEDGTQLEQVSLTIEQELRVLRAFRAIGGVALNGS